MSDKSHDEPNDDYGTYDRFIAYRAATMQAIALAWRDPKFRDEFIENPKKALKKGVGYDFPFNMDLRVDPDSATWEPRTVADWRVNQRNVLQMVLPPRPKDAADRVEALAAFNAKHITFLNS
jgi:ribosomally synthesized peptide (two-chain TOMM family)